jgi:hypothetical protein
MSLQVLRTVEIIRVKSTICSHATHTGRCWCAARAPELPAPGRHC